MVSNMSSKSHLKVYLCYLEAWAWALLDVPPDTSGCPRTAGDSVWCQAGEPIGRGEHQLRCLDRQDCPQTAEGLPVLPEGVRVGAFAEIRLSCGYLVLPKSKTLQHYTSLLKFEKRVFVIRKKSRDFTASAYFFFFLCFVIAPSCTNLSFFFFFFLVRFCLFVCFVF